jgi:hypothetical protein
MVDALLSPRHAAAMPSLFVAPVAPIGWYFGRDDFLRLTVYNGGAGVTAQLRGRVLPIGETTTRDVVRDRSCRRRTAARRRCLIVPSAKAGCSTPKSS